MERARNIMKKCPIPDVGKIWSKPMKEIRKSADEDNKRMSNYLNVPKLKRGVK